jgi:hypothetical protein
MTVEVRLGPGARPSESQRYEQALALFGACAARGAFCEPDAAPRAWDDKQELSAQWTGASLKLSLRTERFDNRALQVLRNLLLAVGSADDEHAEEGDHVEGRIAAIVVELPADPYGQHPDRLMPLILYEDNEDDEYPQPSQRLGFDCQQEEVDDTWVRRCVVEYAAPVAAEEVDRVKAWVAPWFDMLESGGYALPIGLPSQVQSIAGSVVQFDELSIEVSVMRFDACEMAWNPLLNMLDAGRNPAAPVVRVVME